MKFKKFFIPTMIFCLVSFIGVGCKTKEGCGLEEKYAPKTDKDGKLSTKGGDSKLFSPKMSKNMKKKKS